MAGDRRPQRGIDPNVPNVARMYDYALGGKDNYEADRAAMEEIFRIAPAGRNVARVNRRFLGRAVRYLAKQGIRQFLDLGTGLPSVGNVHEVAKQVAPDARVVYVDRDPVVLAHARAMLAVDGNTIVVQADIREPRAILDHPDVRRLFDFSQPVGVLFVAILETIVDTEDPAGLIRAFTDSMAPGSYVAVCHLTSEGRPPTLVATFQQALSQGEAPILYRSRDEIAHLLDGFELVEPGLVRGSEWLPEAVAADDPPGLEGSDDQKAGDWLYAAVGHKPG
jgi:S-adenosyl methyltransferase